MRRKLYAWRIYFVFYFFNVIGPSYCAMTMPQLRRTLDMMRSVCAPKYKVTKEQLDNLRNGVFEEDKELKCYTFCIAQMAGTITKKNEINLEKTIKQLEAMAPAHLRQKAVDTIIKCKDIQKAYKDPCDKTFFSAKCGWEHEPEDFLFP